MSVDYKVKFRISGQALFALFAKMLPIDDVSIEEIPSKLTPVVDPELDKIVRAIAHKPKPQKNKRPLPGPDLKRGINGIVVTALKDKPIRAVDLQPMIKAAGYSANSISSRLEELRKSGVVSRDSEGFWKLNG